MAASRLQTTLGGRTKALCANILIFYICLYAASRNLLPTGGLESVWFLSGLALWFLALLSAPWFVPPKDALANALGAMAIGALAFGALAIGAVAIGRLAIGRAHIRRLEIDELVVHKLTRPEDGSKA